MFRFLWRTTNRAKSTKGSRPIKVKWYYNTDLPVAKPEWYDYKQSKKPERFVPFSGSDSTRLEQAHKLGKTQVDVREDNLFRVDLSKMHLSTIFWEGPVYQVRRGTWFNRDGTPLPPKLAAALEAGYNELQAYAKHPEQAKSQNKGLEGPSLDSFKNLGSSDKAVDISQEDDVVDVGDGQAAIFFDDTYGALFPKKLSELQVNMLRTLKPSYGSLMLVVPIQRGYTENLDSSIIDSVKSTNVTSLTEVFQKEVATIFGDSGNLDKKKEKDDTAERLKLLESVLETDYADESAGARQVDHLVLCVHGIGQLLGYKYELVNFPHSINVMRRTMREVFANEKKYQQLAYGEAYDPKSDLQKANNRIQILPVSWRHRVGFHPRRPFDSEGDKPRLPSSSDINVDGVKPLRNIVGDVILDVLLYYESRYLKQIMDAVLSELNSLYKAYKEQNPDFNGKVHIMGHSLGSTICFDLLSQQDNPEAADWLLDFPVENFFCVGSPAGMFELLKQKNLRSRASSNNEILLDADFSAPKCKNIYNIFHPCDPVSYRMEPLVDPDFARLRAEEVPFALQGFNTQVQNLTSLSEDILEKLSVALGWFKKAESAKGPEKAEENPLGDIITTLTSPSSQKTTPRKVNSEVYDKDKLGELLRLNRTGRIDYSLPMGVFSIALVSAISAHISYFEDEETAGFLMKEILSSDLPPVEKRTVSVFR